MTITEMVRTIGEKVFLLFVALCLVGVFSSVSFAEEAAMNKRLQKLRQREPLVVRLRERSSTPGRPRAKELSEARMPLNEGVQHAGEAAGKGIERGVDATKRGVKRAGEAAGEWN